MKRDDILIDLSLTGRLELTDFIDYFLNLIMDRKVFFNDNYNMIVLLQTKTLISKQLQ